MSTDPATPDLLAALKDSITRAREGRVAMKPSFAKKPEGTATVAPDDLDDEQAAASQVQGVAEAGADVEALVAILAPVFDHYTDHAQDVAERIVGAGWVPAERVAEARAEALRSAELEIRDAKTLDKPTQAAVCAVLRRRARRIVGEA